MVKKVLSLSIGKNYIMLYPIMANNPRKFVEGELTDIEEVLARFIYYIYKNQEITMITYGTTDGLFYTDFEDTVTVPENGVPKIYYYLSFTKCSDEFTRIMIKEMEYWMDSIYLTSLTKKDFKLLNDILINEYPLIVK